MALSAGRGLPTLWRMTKQIALTLNGEPRRFPPATIAEMLTQVGLDERKIAVERNASIVSRSAYALTWLAEGDAIEIVHFIGGG